MFSSPAVDPQLPCAGHSSFTDEVRGRSPRHVHVAVRTYGDELTGRQRTATGGELGATGGRPRRDGRLLATFFANTGSRLRTEPLVIDSRDGLVLTINLDDDPFYYLPELFEWVRESSAFSCEYRGESDHPRSSISWPSRSGRDALRLPVRVRRGSLRGAGTSRASKIPDRGNPLEGDSGRPGARSEALGRRNAVMRALACKPLRGRQLMRR